MCYFFNICKNMLFLGSTTSRFKLIFFGSSGNWIRDLPLSKYLGTNRNSFARNNGICVVIKNSNVVIRVCTVHIISLKCSSAHRFNVRTYHSRCLCPVHYREPCLDYHHYHEQQLPLGAAIKKMNNYNQPVCRGIQSASWTPVRWWKV